MKVISAEELTCYFHGNLGVLRIDGAVRPYRLRETDIPWVHNALHARVDVPAGVRICFHTDAQCITCKGSFAKEGPERDKQKFDLVINGEYVRSVHPTLDGSTLIFQDLPSGDKLVEIWLTTVPSEIWFHHLVLEGGEGKISRYVDKRPRWITHGSSITQCSAAHSPSFAWPTLVANHFGWNLTNLGFGGNCAFDQIVARNIADQECERISLCLGINTVGGAFSHRTWQPAVEGFIFTVRDKHPETPLLLISPICAPNHEDEIVEPSRMGLIPMRHMLEESYYKFWDMGDRNIYFLNGLDLVNQEEAVHVMPVDKLHPDGNGYEFLAKKFIANAPREWTGQA
jgi:hypothetical protein